MRRCQVVIVASLSIVFVLFSMTVYAGNGENAPCPDFFFQNPIPIDDWPEIDSKDGNTAWAVSLGGLIIKTEDGGETWENQWSDLQREDDTPPLRGISVVDNDVVWICGDGGAVISTTDGGATWSLGNIPGLQQAFQLFGISAVSDQVAWVVGAQGTVFRTDDGGKSWAECDVPLVEGDLQDVSALSADSAWVSGERDLVAVTTDGGTSWNRKDPASGNGSAVQRIHAFSNNRVYAIGNEGEFFATTDGGGSWNLTDMGSDNYLFGMSFTDSQNGWISGTRDYLETFMAVTTDGGANWTNKSPKQLTSERNVTAVSLVGTQTIWACTVDGALVRSTDGGSIWDRSDTCWTRATLPGVSVVDSRSAWVAGENGTVMRTFNGGRTWVSQPTNVPYSLYAIDSVDSSTAWAVGDGGTIIKTTDYGKSWSRQSSGTGAELVSLSAVDSEIAWACGSTSTGSVVLRTDDGGDSWESQLVLPGMGVEVISAFDEDRAWFSAISDSDASIYRTTDGGASWKAHVVPRPVSYQAVTGVSDIRVIDEDECLAIVYAVFGTDSFVYIYETTDGGKTWAPLDGYTFADGNMFKLATVDGESIWSCGAVTVPYFEPTSVFYSRDGGKNWGFGKNFHRTVLFNIDTHDGKAFWTTGYMGVIMRSTCPAVYSMSPDTAPNTGVVRISDIAGSGFCDGMDIGLEMGDTRIEATDVDVVSPYEATCSFDLDGAETGTYDVVATNVNGCSERLEKGFTVTTPTEWYLPEGSTGEGADGWFETWVLVENPSEKEANVEITYMTPDGDVQGPVFTMDPMSRHTVNVSDTVPNEYSVSTEVVADAPVVAERAMYWYGEDVYRQCANGSIGLNHLSEDWYMAEGSTGSYESNGFETWVLVQNPGDRQANVSLTYLTPDGRVEGPSFVLDAGSRKTVNVADKVPEEWSVSTIVDSDVPLAAERSTYWNGDEYRQCASASIPASSPSREWYLAEGSTGGIPSESFETWILVENPYEHSVRAKLYYQVPGGQVEGPEVLLEPFSRETVEVARTIPDEYSVSTMVVADGPVVVERSTYWNTDTYRQAANGSVGVMSPHTDWLAAEGSTGANIAGGFETWVLIQNPSDQVAEVELTYMTPDGPVDGPSFPLPANSRRSVSIADNLENTWSVSTVVESDRPVVVERSVYWNDVAQFRRSAHSSRSYPDY